MACSLGIVGSWGKAGRVICSESRQIRSRADYVGANERFHRILHPQRRGASIRD
jgi:hypothetical protein